MPKGKPLGITPKKAQAMAEQAMVNIDDDLRWWRKHVPARFKTLLDSPPVEPDAD